MSKLDALAGSQAYRVETHDGRIGSVAAVLPRAGRSDSGVLLVHSGLLSCRLTAVAFDDVEAVDPQKKRVLLRELPATMRRAAPSGARDRILSHP